MVKEKMTLTDRLAGWLYDWLANGLTNWKLTD